MKATFLAQIFLIFALAGCNPVAMTGALPRDAAETKIDVEDAKARKIRIMYRMLDLVNLARQQNGLTQVELSSALNAAAQTHSFDMSLQNRPWHFGSDGSSPLDRAARSLYTGMFLGENISESYENDFQTIVAWLGERGTRDVILDPRATQIGIGWYQEASGKNWWTLVSGK
ncbi:MAG: CAP domain-containing protein [Albidovulum sp.]|nr:CAP domain-containing protein [Albidovulum sp.]